MTLRRVDQARIEQALAGYEKAIQDAFLRSVQTAANGIDLEALIQALERGDVEGAARVASISRAVLYPVDAAITGAFVASGSSIAASAPVWVATFGFDGRATEAERWARNHVGGLITDIIEDQRAAIREVVADNIGNGVNPRKAALEIAGRVGQSGRREGGLIGLNGPQVRTVQNVRADLANLDERYFTRELRDKRFDPLVKKAIASGKPLSQTDIDRVAGRYADKALAHRAKTIARTESITALREGRRQGIEQAIEQGAIRADRVVREWDSSGDRRVRRDHVIMDGKRVQGMNEPWRLPDGSRMMYPGDSSLGAPAKQTVQCRCLEQFVVDWLRA